MARKEDMLLYLPSYDNVHILDHKMERMGGELSLEKYQYVVFNRV